MSMEQAILEHAGALKELAAAIRDTRTVGFNPALAASYVGDGFAEVDGYPGMVVTAENSKTAVKKNAQAEQDRAEPAARKTKDPVAPSDELEKAVTQVEEAAKAEPELKSAKGGPLDYKTDVVPVLLALQKKNGRLKELLTSFGAAKGDQLKPEQFAEVIAAAEKMAA